MKLFCLLMMLSIMKYDMIGFNHETLPALRFIWFISTITLKTSIMIICVLNNVY